MASTDEIYQVLRAYMEGFFSEEDVRPDSDVIACLADGLREELSWHGWLRTPQEDNVINAAIDWRNSRRATFDHVKSVKDDLKLVAIPQELTDRMVEAEGELYLSVENY